MCLPSPLISPILPIVFLITYEGSIFFSLSYFWHIGHDIAICGHETQKYGTLHRSLYKPFENCFKHPHTHTHTLTPVVCHLFKCFDSLESHKSKIVAINFYFCVSFSFLHFFFLYIHTYIFIFEIQT